MKIILSILSILFFGNNLNAQTNYIKNGDMTGVSLNYIGAELTSEVLNPAIGSGWTGYYGSIKTLNITSSKENGEHGDVIKLAGTATLTNLLYNARLVQRINCPAGIYRLTFWAKSANAKKARLVTSVRSTGKSIPAFLLKDYVNNGTNTENPAHKLFDVDSSWKEYVVDFDLTQTVDSFNPAAGQALPTKQVKGEQSPTISFNLWQTGALNNYEVLIDNVSFVKL